MNDYPKYITVLTVLIIMASISTTNIRNTVAPKDLSALAAAPAATLDSAGQIPAPLDQSSTPASTNPTPTVPIAPTELVSTVTGATQAQLSWKDNSSDEIGWVIESETGSTWTDFSTFNSSTNSTSYTANSLSPGTTYIIL